MHTFFTGRLYQPDESTLRVITRNNWMVTSGPTSHDVTMIVTPAVQVSFTMQANFTKSPNFICQKFIIQLLLSVF